LTTLLLVGVGYFVTGLSFSPVLFLLSLILFNIPTLVFCLVFRARRRRHEQTDLNRMRIDDLE